MAALLDLVAPPRCFVCRTVAAPPWCDRCEAHVARHRIARDCVRCGIDAATAAHGCWGDRAAVTSTTALFRYRDEVADTVVTAKVRGAAAAWRPLGARLAVAVRRHATTIDAVTFVPTEPRRRRRRGFDHAALLADGVADGLGVPAVGLLLAARGAPDQGARSPEARRTLPFNPFTSRRRLAPVELLLVDDVLTTGATARSAASTLVGAGAVGIHLAVVARAGRHPLGAAS